MTFKETFVENLSKIRGKLTNKELAEIAQVSTGTMSKYLKPKEYPTNIPPADVLYRLCKHFNVSIDWLLGMNLSPRSEKKATMCDIISALFELEKVDFDINERQTPSLDANPLTGEPYNTILITHDISFRLNYLDNFLAEWKEARSIALKNDKPIYKQMYELWKKDKLNAAANESLSGYSIEHTFMDELDELPFN